MPTPQELASAKLADSGLDTADAKALGITAMDAKAFTKLRDGVGAKWDVACGIKLQYWSLDGKATPFWRYRYLEDPRPAGFAQAAGKAPRYLQPPKTPCEAYFPPINGVVWADLARDPTQPVCITEGELKAACATKLGIHTIGLGGVYSFMSSSQGVAFLPALKSVAWGGREVFIVYDSDSVQNPMVSAAQLKLAQQLLQYGAAVSIATIPSRTDGGKQGLDDYLVAYGKTRFLDEVLSDAAILEQSEALNAMNDLVAVVHNPTSILDLKKNRVMSLHDFEKVSFRNYIHNTRKQLANGNVKFEKQQTATAWLQWPYRKEFDSMVYEPGAPREHDGSYNQWPGFKAKPVKGDVKLWHKMMDHIFKHESVEARRWFEQWCAYPIQKPGTKHATAVVLYSRTQGSGKSIIGETFQEIYGDNLKFISEEDLGTQFNSWANCTQMAVGEEIGSGETRKTVIADRIKDMITRTRVQINEKNVKKYYIRDCINFMFYTNHLDAFLLEETDRRMLVVQLPEDRMSKADYNAYGAWMHSQQGRNALMHYFCNMDLTGFDIKADAFATQAKQHMKESNRSDLVQWAIDLQENPREILGGAAHTRSAAKTRDMFTPGELMALWLDTNKPPGFKLGSQGFARVLSGQAGVPYAANGAQIQFGGRKHKMFVLFNKDRWMSARPADVKAHVEGRLGALRAPPKNKK